MADPIVITTGRLDGLNVQPICVEGSDPTHLHFTVDTLPGLRIIVEAAAARELRDALCVLLGSPEVKNG